MEPPWNAAKKASLGRWDYPSDWLGKTYEFRYSTNFPSAGNPTGFPGVAGEHACVFFEIGHTDLTSGHFVAVDTDAAPDNYFAAIDVDGTEPGYEYQQVGGSHLVQWDTWVQWRFVIKWSYTANGFVRIYKDGALFASKEDFASVVQADPDTSGPPSLHTGWYSIDEENNQILVGGIKGKRSDDADFFTHGRVAW